jgi:hypothetical protein
MDQAQVQKFLKERRQLLLVDVSLEDLPADIASSPKTSVIRVLNFK